MGAPDFSESSAPTTMGNITINLSKFWENNVRLQFLMVKNIFAMKIASEFLRHELSLSSSELPHLQSVEHVLLDLDPVYLFSYLKSALVEIFGQTEEHQLLYACNLGDRKPTELLAEMRKLLWA